MTQIEQEALVLFKDYTHLQLKAFYISELKRLNKSAGGATEPYELLLLNQALTYHKLYLHIKLNKPKNEPNTSKN